MKLIQIFLPLKDKKGESFRPEFYSDLKTELTKEFGGITMYSRVPATGLWKNEEDTIERDTIVIYEVVAKHLDQSYWLKLQSGLEKRFEQDQIMIRSMDLEVLKKKDEPI